MQAFQMLELNLPILNATHLWKMSYNHFWELRQIWFQLNCFPIWVPLWLLSHSISCRRTMWETSCRGLCCNVRLFHNALPSLVLGPKVEVGGDHTLPCLTSESQQPLLGWPLQPPSLLQLLCRSFSFKLCWLKRVITSYGAQEAVHELNSHNYILINKQNISFILKLHCTYVFRPAVIYMLKTSGPWVLLHSVLCSKTKFSFPLLNLTWLPFPEQAGRWNLLSI